MNRRGLLAATGVLSPGTRLQPVSGTQRVPSIDVLRGAIMVLMAIDHVRVYSGVPAGGPMPGVFFTRWITHFCAPGFVFFAGTSAFLYARKHGGGVSRWLAVRGLFLVLLELTVLRLSWTFNFDYQNYVMAGVLWAIGWSMVALAGLVLLPQRVVLAAGLAIVFLHNLLDARAIGASLHGPALALWQIFYGLGAIGPLKILYTLVPWIGVTALGWSFGAILDRRRACLLIGAGAIVLFVVLRATSLYGDPRPWAAAGPPAMAPLLRFLNTAKYPASLQFLLMTLGPLVALVPIVRRAPVLETFGRVPLFFYLLHIPLIHALALIVSKLREGTVDPWLFGNHPLMPPDLPPGYTWELPLLYLVTAIAVALLYPLCAWYADVKARSRNVVLGLV
ncbi:MAG: DUF1624 domain-containing protein [Gemmatimonadales bacterium]|nr:heparan-alpha-glucosaminide N-acetyltransferase domain-containing protein [Myxococcales bacterium]